MYKSTIKRWNQAVKATVTLYLGTAGVKGLPKAFN